MRRVFQQAAQHLGSVSARYRSPLHPVWPRSPLRTGAQSIVARPKYQFLATGATGSDWLAKNVEAGESDKFGDELTRRARLEAVLFLSKEPLKTRKLAQLANLVDGTDARTLVRQLNRIYDETGRAFRIEEIAGGLQLRTRPQFANWLRRLGHVPKELRLSAPAMETLAVVAYRQPTLRANIEAVRGVACGEILRQLMDRDLVRVAGRSNELGRPYLYGTTRQFLQVFGLRSLDELPRAKVFREPLVDNSLDQSQAGHDSEANVGPPHEGVSDVNVTVAKQDVIHPGTEPDEKRARGDIRGDDDWDDDELDDDQWDDDDELDDDELDDDELDDDELDDDDLDDEEEEDDEEWDDEDDDDLDDDELDDDEEWVEVDDDEESDDEDWIEVDDDEDEDDDLEEDDLDDEEWDEDDELADDEEWDEED